MGRSVRRGVAWGVLAQAAIQVGSVLATMVLSRLLEPSDFGLLALIASLNGLAAILSAGGLGTVIVTRRDIGRADVATLFWASVLLGAATSLLLATLAPLMAHAFNASSLRQLATVACLAPALSSAAVVPQALLQRELRFGAYNASLVLGAGVYFVSEVLLALAGFGAWAVVVGMLSGNFATLLTSLAVCRPTVWHRPTPSSLRKDALFTGGLSVAQLLTYVQRNVDYWVVGRALGTGPLGVYYIAFVLPSVIRQRVSWVGSTVLLPSFSAIGDDSGRRALAWRRAWLMQMSLMLPLAALVIPLAPALLQVFFGSEWQEAAGPLRLLTLLAVIECHILLTSSLATASGLFFRSLATLGARVIITGLGCLLAVSLDQGLMGVAAAVLVSAAISAAVQEVWISRTLGVGLRRVGWNALILLAASGMAGAAALGVHGSTALPAAAALGLSGTVVVLVFLLVLLLAGRALLAQLRAEGRRIVASLRGAT